MMRPREHFVVLEMLAVALLVWLLLLGAIMAVWQLVYPFATQP
jgi:hypothetical protein